MRRVWLLVAGAVAAVAVAAGAVAVLRAVEGDAPDGVARRWLATWSSGQLEDLPALAFDPPPTLVDDHEQMDGALRVADRTLRLGDVDRDGGRARASFTATLQLAGLGEWRYEGELALVRRDGRWLVDWEPEALHPERHDGLRFDRTREWPARAPIVGADGTALAGDAEVIAVGVEPRRIRDRAEVASALGAELDIGAAALDRALDRPGVQPDHFVPLVELRPDRYAEVRPALFPVPGIVFRRTTARLPLSPELGAHTVGRVGEVTAERLEELGEPYQVGDEVGLSGLEGAFERELAGAPSGEVRLVDASGAVAGVLRRFPGRAPEPLATTLDLAVQQAAEQALAGVREPAGLVALEAATGAVRAVVSRPLDEAFNRALDGRYPPGSTFKVVTTVALLGAGMTPDTPVECPPEATIGGKVFRNFEGEALGAVPFRDAFVHSCNTAFAQLAVDAGGDAIAEAARRFGFGTGYDMPLPVTGGAFPEPGDTVEVAAAAIGQGRVTASPLHMATVAAAVASGRWRAPLLVSGAGGPTEGPPLDPAVAATIGELMRGVVASGTGTAAQVAGPPVAGKTGTAEFGTGSPPPTHAWFLGFRGDLAFAVVVEGGGVGGRVAAPVAARFLNALA